MMNLDQLQQDYDRDGYISPVRMVSEDAAHAHRTALEQAESTFGSLHYKSKAHTILRSPLELATLPAALDVVERLIGPDILLYNVTYIIKEAGTESHVSWHQDLTYWGLSHDDQVSMWLALSPATPESGCMRVIPGSHKLGVFDHHATDDANNVLLQGQTVRDVPTEDALHCSLRPGEASFHHGWTLHDSSPNTSADRRIGLNVQYVAAHVRQTKHDLDTAMVVRGTDNYGHFGVDIPAASDLDPEAIARQAELERRYVAIAGTA